MSVLRDSEARESRSLSPQAAARRESILEAALATISRKGFHETSIADIAKRARASRATVYQYFADKRGILGAIGQRVEKRIIDAVDAWVQLPPGPPATEGATGPSGLVDRLRTLIDTRTAQVVGAIWANADAARLVLRHIRGNDPLFDEAMRRIDAHVVGILAKDVQVAIGHGWARPCDPETVARYLLGGIEKILMAALDAECPVDLDVRAVVREVGALVFFGLANPDLLNAAGEVPVAAARTAAKPRRDGASQNKVPATHPEPSARRPESEAGCAVADPRGRGPSGRDHPM
jgi:AcrR family transcriptional regulator